jgi:hypothetical protein
MPPPSPVADYLDALSRELAFDPALSRRVRHEVEDHLREAVMAEPADRAFDAECRVVSRFGAAGDIAAQYRAVSLYMRMRKTGTLVLCAVAAVFAAMESRVAWYDLTQWRVSEGLKAAGAIVVPIDRYAFLFAIGCAILGWLYVARQPMPANFPSAGRDRLRRGQILAGPILAGTTALALALAVTCEAFLTGWRLLEAQWSVNAVFPVASMVIEVGAVVAIAAHIRNTVRGWLPLVSAHE